MTPKDPKSLSGVQAVVDMFAVMDPQERERLLRDLAERDPALVEEIHRRIFTFEDLGRIEDHALRDLIQKVPRAQLALALRHASEEIRSLIFRNLSERAGKILAEEIRNLGPQRLSDVQAAQAKIAELALKLSKK